MEGSPRRIVIRMGRTALFCRIFFRGRERNDHRINRGLSTVLTGNGTEKQRVRLSNLMTIINETKQKRRPQTRASQEKTFFARRGAQEEAASFQRSSYWLWNDAE